MTLSESRSGLILQRGLYLAVCVPRESLHAALYFIVCVPRERLDYVHFSSGPRSEPVRAISGGPRYEPVRADSGGPRYEPVRAESGGPRYEPVREIAEFTVDPGKSRCVRLRCESVCG